MRLDVKRGQGFWAYTVQTAPARWWGLCRVDRTTYLDLGRVRVSRRGKWTPLFTEPHTFGPFQWWAFK